MTKDFIEFEFEQVINFKSNKLDSFKNDNMYVDSFTNKINKKIKISKKILEETLYSYSGCVGYDLTFKDMIKVILNDNEMIQELEYCAKSGKSTLTDTVCRDKFCNAFAHYLLNDERRWPRHGDSESYTSKFLKDLNSAAKKRL